MGTHANFNWDEHPKTVELLLELRRSGWSYSKVAKELNKKFGLTLNEHVTKRAYNRFANEQHSPASPAIQEAVAEAVNNDINYKETTEIGPDGSHKSDKLLRMSSEQQKDADYLLDAHGYKKEAWELVTARNNIWNSYSKQDGIMTMYASKITVKPRTNTFSMEKLIEAIKDVPSVLIKTNKVKIEDKRLLEIPFFDSHFGISNREYYQKTELDTVNTIQSRKWEEILFIVGQDLLHNDNFKGQTANGTLIESVDMNNAWEDCKAFYYSLIEEAIVNANAVKIIFSKGNHDESMSWAFVQLLKERYPQVEVDDRFVERKAHTFGEVFIGITHGDKARKNLHNIFPVEFPTQWAQAKTRELHTGHYHVEDARDVFGMMVRTLATRNKTDQWHKDNGFVGAHKRFMLFEYDIKDLKRIHYV